MILFSHNMDYIHKGVYKCAKMKHTGCNLILLTCEMILILLRSFAYATLRRESCEKMFKSNRALLHKLTKIVYSYCYFTAPSGSPTNVHCQSRSPNSILLEWSKPKRGERNGIIRGYWIEYYPRTLWYGK